MKKFKIVLLILLAFIGVLSFTSYHSGIDVEVLKEKYLYPESDFIAFEGMNIHYRKTGSGPTLFLMHGVSSSLHTWEVWQEKLSKDFTVITIDIPSFGLTGPNPQEDYSLEMYMRTIDHITSILGIDTMYIGGNSYGGYLSWNYAIHQPEKVKKVLLLDAAGYEIKGFKDLGFKLMSNSYLGFVATRFTPKFVVIKSTKNVYGNPDLLTDEVATRYYDLLLRKGNRDGFVKILQDKKDWKATEANIKKVSQPTLIIWGSDDQLIPVADAFRFNKDIVGSEIKIYDGVGHVPMEEIPNESAELAREFLLR